MRRWPWADLAEGISRVLPHSIQVVQRRGLADVIAAVAEVVERRLQGEDLHGPSVYLIILELHRARDLRPNATVEDA